MRVQWATNEKAMMASNKHFSGSYTPEEMTTIATFLLKRAEYVGKSDRSNGKYDPARIIWSIYQGTTYAIVCLLYTSPSPRDRTRSRMPSSA